MLARWRYFTNQAMDPKISRSATRRLSRIASGIARALLRPWLYRSQQQAVHRAILLVSAALILLAEPKLTSQIHTSKLQAWLSRSASRAAVAADMRVEDKQYWNLVDDIDNVEHQGMRLIFASYLRKYLPISAESAERVTAALLKQDLRGSRKLAFYLGVVDKISLVIPRADATKILKRTLDLATAPQDPYEDTGVSISARDAAIAVLLAWPHLTDQVHSRLTEYPNQRDELVTILALLSQRKAEPTARTFTDTVSSLALDHSESTALADRFSWTTNVSARTLDQPPVPMIRSSYPVDLSRWLTPIFLVVLYFSAVVKLANRYRWPSPPVPIGLSQALPLVALLVTANVLTITLSNTRLPGSVARTTAQGWQLRAAYTAALLLVLTSLSAAEDKAPSSQQWGRLALLLGFVVFIVLLVPTILANTDAAIASKRFASSRIWRARAAGKKLGKIQAKAIRYRHLVSQQDGISIDVGAGHPARSTVIIASKRGLFCPDPRKLERTIREPAAAGARLVILKPIGSVVNSGDSTVLIVPPESSSISLRIKKTVERSSRVLNLERFDRLGRDCTTLAGLSFKLAEDGDISAAEMVGPYSANLLRIFQFYVERHRRKRVELMIQEGRVLADELDDRRFAIDEDEAKVVPPTSPTSALADIVYRCAITGNSASTLALAISEKMIGTSDPSDSLTSQAISILHELAGADASRAGAVLAIATKVGLRSLEIDDPFTFERAAKFIAQQEDDKTPSSLAVLSAGLRHVWEMTV